MSKIFRLMKSLFTKSSTIAESVQLPHEVFPEILLWKKYDILDYPIHKYYIFLEVMENGDCAIKACSRIEIWSIHKLKKWTNYSLRERKIKKQMSENQYTQFINDFQHAYKEIKQ